MSELIDVSTDAELEVMPSFDFLSDEEKEQDARLAEHRAWLRSIRRERPLPKDHFKVAVYIRYFNQTKHDDYLEVHKQHFLDTLALCPNWEFIGFYIDEGGSAPNMESAKEWSQLLEDGSAGKVDLIITQKIGNVSKKPVEISFCARTLAALEKPVGIYFVSEDIYTLASYYQSDLKDTFFLPAANEGVLPDTELNLKGLPDGRTGQDSENS